MADGSILIEIKGDSSDIESSIERLTSALENDVGQGARKADESIGQTNDSLKNMADTGLKAVTAAAAAMAAAISGAAAAVVSVGSNYESAFAQVETIMDTSIVSTADMSSAIIDLSNQTGAAATDLSEAVYNAISATGDTANAVGLVADATKLATAGFAESSDALDVLATITNAYGIATSEASAISDSLIQTQNLGVVTVAQLSTTMGKAIATAAAYSIDLYNLEAAYVSLTKAGISAEESTTYVSAMFNELGDSGSDVSEIIQNETGKSFGQLMEAGYSLGDVLNILVEYVDGDTEALMNLWGSAQAGKAASAIASQGLSEFNGNLDSLRNSAGATENAYQTMTQTFAYQTDVLKTRVTNLGTLIYEKFSGSAVRAVESLAEAMGELIDRMQNGDLADEVDAIAESLSGLVDGAAGFISETAPKLIEALSWLLQHSGAIAAEIGVLAASFGTLKAVLTIGQLTSTISSLSGAAAGLVGTGLSVAGSIAGWGTAAVVAGVAFSEMVSWMQEDATGLGDNTAALASNQVQIESNAESVQAAIDKYRELRGEISANKAEASGQIDSLESLIAAYDGTASSAQEIQNVITTLNGLIPGLNLAFDEQSGTLNKSASEMAALNAAYAASSTYDAAVAYRTSMNEANASSIDAQAAAQENLNTLMSEFEEWKGMNPSAVAAGYEGSAAYAAWVDRIAEAEAALDAASNQVDTTSAAVDIANAEVEKAANMYDVAAEKAAAYAAAEEEVETAAGGLSDEQKEVASTLTSIRKDARGASGSATELREQYNTLLKAYEALDTEGLDYAAGLTEQALEQLNLAATTAELHEALGTLSTISGLDFTTIASQLITTGTSADTFAKSVTSALSSVVNGYASYSQETYTTLAESTKALQENIESHANWQSNITALWNAAVASGSTSQMAYVQSLYEMGDASSQIVQDLQGNGAALEQNAALYAQATQEAASEAALGLAMQAGTIYDAAAETATQGAEGFAAASGEAEASGSELSSGAAAGVGQGASEISSAAQSAVQEAASAASGVDFSSVGSNISAGIASGIRAGGSAVTSAAIAVINSAKTAANNAAQIHSPSKLFEKETGYWIPAGIAKGMESGKGLVQKAAVNVVHAAKVATSPIVQTVSSGASGNTTNIYNSGSATGSGASSVTVPLYINGREFARATSDDTWNQLDYSF